MKYTKTDIREAWKIYSLVNFDDPLEKTQTNRMVTAFFKFLSDTIPRGRKISKEELKGLVEEFHRVINRYYSYSRPGIARLYKASTGGAELNELKPIKREYELFRKHFIKAIETYL
ncbi:hypothetical protein SAMN06265339_0683 [Desulfurobacterium pacificum]|uniref:Uncharacterized protein n=1 Tax=Desulfurobacterium pacificum TaxID=240166 RepID=A0ABY1NGC1_9BACT|nr:hypothetical protein [Desulfurobacterium pacificum]SMP09025.1 hypothetical protein SAMN06265339_0683 [Desulfurobacterium pacificum]